MPKNANAYAEEAEETATYQRRIQKETALVDKHAPKKKAEHAMQAGARKYPEPLYVFLASAHCSSYITGEILPIIGGYSGG